MHILLAAEDGGIFAPYDKGGELFIIDADTVDWLLSHGVVDQPLADWLADFTFSGNIWGYGEGEVYFPGAPLLVVEGSFAEACILETVLLSIFNYDSAVASAASRMTAMAGQMGMPFGRKNSPRKAAKGKNKQAGKKKGRGPTPPKNPFGAGMPAGFPDLSNMPKGLDELPPGLADFDLSKLKFPGQK